MGGWVSCGRVGGKRLGLPRFLGMGLGGFKSTSGCKTGGSCSSLDLSNEYTFDGASLFGGRPREGASNRGILDLGRPLFLGEDSKSWETTGGIRFALGGRPTGRRMGDEGTNPEGKCVVDF